MIGSLKYLYYLLGISKNELTLLIESKAKYYYQKEINKFDESGNPRIKNGIPETRLLCPSKGKLKIVQGNIKYRIFQKFPFPNHVVGGIKGKDNILNARIHKGKKHKFKTDLKDFFPSVKHYMVYNSLVDHKFSPDVSHILTELTTFEGCVPQGTPTSPYVANMAALVLDAKLIKFCQPKNIIYTRYIDDMTFSSSSDFQDVVIEIKNIIEDCHFGLNQRKTIYKIGPMVITGILTANNYIRPPQEKLAKLLSPNLSEASRLGLQNYINRIKNNN